jgi:hypothetical protein
VVFASQFRSMILRTIVRGSRAWGLTPMNHPAEPTESRRGRGKKGGPPGFPGNRNGWLKLGGGPGKSRDEFGVGFGDIVRGGRRGVPTEDGVVAGLTTTTWPARQ